MAATVTTPSPRRAVGALLAVLGALVVVVGSAGAASAEDGYRYWNYSHLEGASFAFAETGPGDYTPKDGDVEGWRYGTSTVSQGISPRADVGEVGFDAVCGDVDAAAGQKRVAVVVDYGDAADAADAADAQGAEVPEPRADCAVVPAKANGQQVLESVVDLRTDQGMICALDGYPAKGCGEPVADAKVTAQEQTVAFTLPATDAEGSGTDEPSTSAAAAEESDGSGWTLFAVLGAALVLAAVAVPLYRRNRDA